MNALTFVYVPKWDRWVGYQPDQQIVGYVKRSRFTDDRPGKYARTWEATLCKGFDTITQARGHCGYAGDPDEAKRLLVSGAAFYAQNRGPS